MTIHEAILYGESRLNDGGIDQPRWNSERLLLLALHQPRSKLYADLTRELSIKEQSRFHALLEKRSEHYPLAYLEGTQEFFGHDFLVNESVLIPRPETELVIHAVLSLPLKNPWILDLGSGSGVIPVTLAREIPGSRPVALEISASAIDVLRKNSNLAVPVVRGDFSSLCFLPETFDVITANLPYVETDDFAALPAETSWEPQVALLTQSLEESYLAVMQQSVRLLKLGGYLVMEIGYGQADRLKAVCASVPPLKLLEIRNDQQRIPRILVLQRL